MKVARLITWRVDPYDSNNVEATVKCSSSAEAQAVADKLNAREYAVAVEVEE